MIQLVDIETETQIKLLNEEEFLHFLEVNSFHALTPRQVEQISTVLDDLHEVDAPEEFQQYKDYLILSLERYHYSIFENVHYIARKV